MKWERKSIGDVCYVGDGAHASIKRQPDGFQYLSSKNFKLDGLDLSKVDFISEADYQKHFKDESKAITKPKFNDVLLSIIGSLGAPYLVKQDDIFGLSSSVSILRPNNEFIDPNFLYYWIKSNEFQSSINNIKSGVAQSFLSLGMIKSLPVIFPNELPTQRKIASILSAYDDLIENNLKRIKLLEEQAFLKYKGIVSSEKLKAVQLKDVAVVNESTLKANSNIDKLLYVDIASVSTGSIDNKTEYDLKEAPGRAKRILKHEDIIWSCVRPNRKSYAFVWQPENNLIASTGFAVITSKAIPSTFLYQLTTANEFVSYLENHAKGATYPAVTATDFAEALINIPADSIMQEYHDAVSPCYELKSILQKQNTKLREARDILLPKLMNGQIEV